MAGSTDVVHAGDALATQGQPDVLVQDVYRRYRDRVIGFFVHRTHDRALAEDLTHDTFVRFAGALDRFDPERQVWPYLKVIATHVLIDHNRRDGRRVVMDVEEDLVDQGLEGDDLDDTVVLRSLLDRAIGDLSERQRVAVELRCARGWNVAESAEFLGIDPAAFRQLLFRARRNLRAALEESGARLGGLVVPALVALRLRTRSAVERVREFLQPSTSFGVEALAGVAVAATIGVTAAVGIPTAEAEPQQPSHQVLELVRQDVTPSTAPPVEQQDHEVAVSARYTPAPAPTPDVPVEEAPEPSNRNATVIETPDAVPDSGGHVTVEDDQEYFVVSNQIEARTGIESVDSDGDAIAIHCASVEGDIVCADRET